MIKFVTVLDFIQQPRSKAKQEAGTSAGVLIEPMYTEETYITNISFLKRNLSKLIKSEDVVEDVSTPQSVLPELTNKTYKLTLQWVTEGDPVTDRNGKAVGNQKHKASGYQITGIKHVPNKNASIVRAEEALQGGMRPEALRYGTAASNAPTPSVEMIDEDDE